MAASVETIVLTNGQRRVRVTASDKERIAQYNRAGFVTEAEHAARAAKKTEKPKE